MIVGHHALLVVAVCALALAGWGLAARSAPLGAERVLAAAAYATALAALEALALGLVGLGASPLALTAAALMSWLVARAPGRAVRVGAGAAAGLGVVAAIGAWQLRHPAVGVDGVGYHLPEIVQWVASGHTGRTPTVSVEFPTGAYPLVNEVVLAWGTAIGRSWVFETLWAPATWALLALAGWTGLRALRVPPLRAALAVAAVLLLPDVVRALNTPKNDLPALAWLATCGALAARGRIAPAIVAAGLAVGTKTTTAPLVLLVLVLAVRPPLRPLVRPAIAALVLGGVWYLRNTINHGWPLWPVSSGPTGDALPDAMRRIHVSLLQRPGATLTSARLSAYAGVVAGGIVLLAGGIVGGLLGYMRPKGRPGLGRGVLIASAATLASLLLYAAAPFTGASESPVLDLSLTTTRYLLPAIACGAVALALAGRIGTLLLALAAVWSLARAWHLGYPYHPGAGTLIAGALAGAVGGAVVRRAPRLTTAVGATITVLALSASSTGWLHRTAGTGATQAAPLERWFDAQPGFHDAHEPIAMSPQLVGPLAGDRVTHDVRLIGPEESCARIAQRTREGWVVVRTTRLDRYLAPRTAPRCLRNTKPLAIVGDWRVYRQTATRSSAVSTPSARSSKSVGVIKPARGSADRRARRNSAS